MVMIMMVVVVVVKMIKGNGVLSGCDERAQFSLCTNLDHDDNGGSDYDLSDRDDEDHGKSDDDSDDHTRGREGGVGRSLRISMQGCTK